MNVLIKLYQKVENFLPFKLHYLLTFKSAKKRWPHIGKKKDYCDYIFWDNFWGRHDHHAFLADKLEVRRYVESKGLASILTSLYGSWDNADKIDFDTLPEQFALKCNHSCAMNIICYDKSKLNIEATRLQLNKWLGEKHSKFYERHYQKIKPMVICEELIPNNKDGFFPMDYKIHCANGDPIFIQCCFDRTSDSVGKRVIYSPDWQDLHFVKEDYHYSEEMIPAPKHLNEMLYYAHILSKGLKYARIDFYDTDTRVIFGEITLTPMGGWLSYFKQEALDLMGKCIRDR